MAEIFQDNVVYGTSTLAVSGDAVAIGSTNAGAKSVIFNNSGSQGHLAWQPTANRTINLPDSGGTIQLTGQVPGAIYDGANSISSGTIRFTNANGVSFSINGQTISGSVAAQSAQTQSLIAGVYDGANSISTGTIIFTNANGVSFSVNGQTISGSVAAQTVQTVGLYALGNTTQNSSTTLDARTLSFNGLGNITVGYSNGSIQISGAGGGGASVNFSAGTTSNNLASVTFSNSNGVSFGLNGSTITGSVAVQTNQTVGIYAVSNSTQSSSGTLDARSLSFQGAGIASVGYTNGSVVISVPSGGGAGDGVNIIAAGTQTAATTGTVVFSNSNGISFGMSNSSIVTASYTVPTQTAQTVGLYALGNTTQNSSTTLDARTLSFNGLGIITAGYSNGSIQISATQSAQTQNVVVPSAGTQTATSGTAIFSNSNGITFGMSNSSVITASFNGTLNSVVFSNANNITFGSAGNTTITASYSQSNQDISLFGLGNTTQNSSTHLGAAVMSFNGLGNITVGYSNGSIQISGSQSAQTQSMINGIYDGANSISRGTIRFTNANGVSFSINGQTLSGSVAAQTAQTVGLYALGNTTQNSSTTLDARTLSFNGLGGVSVGYSNGSIQISGGGGAAISAGANSTQTGTVVFSNSNNITFGMSNNGVVTASFNANNTASTFVLGISTQGNTSGTTGFANQSVQLVGTNGITLSQSINGNSATITMSGFLGNTYSSYQPYVLNNSNSALLSFNSATSGNASFFPFHVYEYVQCGWLNMIESISIITTSIAVSQSITMNFGLYSRGTGANSSTLGTMTTASYGMSASWSSRSFTINQPTSTNSAGYTTNTVSGSTTAQMSTSYSGLRMIQFPINSTLTPGQYWIGILAALNTAGTSSVGLQQSFVGFAAGPAMMAQSLGPIGSATSAYSTGTAALIGQGNWYMGLASYSGTGAGQTSLPVSVPLSNMTHNQSVIPYMLFMTTT